MTQTSDFAGWLRAQPSLTGVAPPLSTAELASEPVTMFREWIRQAVEAGVVEPLAMTLATFDADGIPDARTVILKDADERGWAFAGPRRSAKSAQLVAHPAAALNFWWQPLVRAVRLRGRVVAASEQDAEADYAARPTSTVVRDVAPDWGLWRLEPSRVEFWQGEVDRRHSRIVFDLSDGEWIRSLSGRIAD